MSLSTDAASNEPVSRRAHCRYALVMTETDDILEKKSKPGVRRRADEIAQFRCKNTVAVLENPAKLVNLASVIRNVNAMGIEKVFVIDHAQSLPDDWQDMRERRSLRKASVSAVKWTYVKRFDTTAECHEHLRKKQYVSVATSPHVKNKKSLYLDEADFTPHAKLAVWFGTEGRGLTDEAIEGCEMCVAVPMFGMVESLNLGTCSGIVLYEVAKQRRAYQSRFRKSGHRGRRAVPLPTVMPLGER